MFTVTRTQQIRMNGVTVFETNKAADTFEYGNELYLFVSYQITNSGYAEIYLVDGDFLNAISKQGIKSLLTKR